MNRSQQHQSPQQPVFRFNKVITTPAGGVPTPPPNNNSANNSGDESPAAKRKISTENGTSAVYQQSQATTQIKKPRNENESGENGGTPAPTIRTPLQCLTDLGVFHKLRINYDLVSETGEKYSKVYEIKVSLTDANGTELETYTASGPNVVKAKQNAAEIAWAQTKLEKPPTPPNTIISNAPVTVTQTGAGQSRPGYNNQNNNWNGNNRGNQFMNNRGGGVGANKPYQQQQYMMNQPYYNNNQNNRNNQQQYQQYQQQSISDAGSEYEEKNKQWIKKHLLTRHTQLQPSSDRTAVISRLLDLIQAELKWVSEELVKSALPEDIVASEASNDVLELYRHVIGVYRVGQLEKGTVLVTDSVFELVLLFDRHPRVDLVQKVLNLLRDSSKLFVKPESDEAGFDRTAIKLSEFDEETLLRDAYVVVSYEPKEEQLPIRFKISFGTLIGEEETETSTPTPETTETTETPEIKEENGNGNGKEHESETTKKPTDKKKQKSEANARSRLKYTGALLPWPKCQRTQLKIKRTEWFTSHIKPYANAMLLLRVMRDLSRRVDSWRVLINSDQQDTLEEADDWIIELLIDKCFQRNRYECITLKFRSLFEILSAGLALLDDNQLNVVVDASNEHLVFVDPFSTSTSVFSRLTPQQREDLTASAQNMLRLVAVNRVNEVLGMEVVTGEQKSVDTEIVDENAIAAADTTTADVKEPVSQPVSDSVSSN